MKMSIYFYPGFLLRRYFCIFDSIFILFKFRKIFSEPGKPRKFLGFYFFQVLAVHLIGIALHGLRQLEKFYFPFPIYQEGNFLLSCHTPKPHRHLFYYSILLSEVGFLSRLLDNASSSSLIINGIILPCCVQWLHVD